MTYRVKHDKGFRDEPDLLNATQLAVQLNGTVEIITDDLEPTQSLEEAIARAKDHIRIYFDSEEITDMLRVLLANSGLVAAAKSKVMSYWTVLTNLVYGDEPELSQIEKLVAIQEWIDGIKAAAKNNPATFDPLKMEKPTPPFLYKDCL